MFDLHVHSYYSDGSLSPESIVEKAHANGLSLIALTDHNTTDGIERALVCAKRLGQPFLTGVELEADYDEQLHLLGLGVDSKNKALANAFEKQAKLRNERNDSIIWLLKQNGMDITAAFQKSRGCTNRAHIAAALVKLGYAKSTDDAFARLIGKTAKYYVPAAKHLSIEETMSLIRTAGGVAVFAHPVNMSGGQEELARRLCALGLWGVEAYYGHSTSDEIARFCKMASRLGLHITCGSDFHGDSRPNVEIGCSWRDADCLRYSEIALKTLFAV